jgi:hypothetical protein
MRARAKCSLFHNDQARSVSRPAPYPVGTGAITQVIKLPQREAEQSPPSYDLTNRESIPPLLHTCSWNSA